MFAAANLNFYADDKVHQLNELLLIATKWL